MRKDVLIAIAIGAILLIGIIGATAVTAKDISVFGKTPPSVTKKLRASFSADVTSGESPLTVHFTDASIGTGITPWSRSFGDGSTSPL